MVEICHAPNGNTTNKQTLLVSESGAAGHLKHGDTLGPCDAPPNNYPPVISNMYPGGNEISFNGISLFVLSATVTDADLGAVLTVQACFGVSGNTPTCMAMNQSGSTWSFAYDLGNYYAGYDHYWYVEATDGVDTVSSSVVSFNVAE